MTAVFPRQQRRLFDCAICDDGPGELRSHQLHRQGDSHVSSRAEQRGCVGWGVPCLLGGIWVFNVRQGFGTRARFSPLTLMPPLPPAHSALLQWGMCLQIVLIKFPKLKNKGRFSFCCHDKANHHFPSCLCTGGCSQASAGTKP